MNRDCVVFWFRRDLRWRDNVGLYHALKSGLPVLPLFIFDRHILDELPADDRRVRFIWETLMDMDQQLYQEKRTRIHIAYGTPLEVFTSLIENHAIRAVYTNRDYEPYARKRDEEIRALLNPHGIKWNDYKDQVIFEKDEINKDDGDPYVVYTPYRKKWEKAFSPSTDLLAYDVASEEKRFLPGVSRTALSLESMGFTPSRETWPRYSLAPELIRQYSERRNYPGIEGGTSRIGLYLRFGTISIREAVRRSLNREHPTFLHELIWREFFMQILWNFPHTATASFRREYDQIEWRNNTEEFELWKQGQTGFPLVDAGMRELNQTGYMHNRVRMVVSSFLCKHLLIDWRWGEAYFAQKLLDYELASNVGNWQWAAGSGVDAAPYFRIFNPTSQIAKFDKGLAYIARWVPEFQDFAYPEPMVDHRMARERCLRVYRESLADPGLKKPREHSRTGSGQAQEA